LGGSSASAEHQAQGNYGDKKFELLHSELIKSELSYLVSHAHDYRNQCRQEAHDQSYNACHDFG